jgi:aryl-alcohol dehydrogenase-like predicted oxidoreductase
MQPRKLGRTGLKVSPLCLGAMMFGDQTMEQDAVSIVHKARDVGVNFIDTADVYADGQSEQIVGRAIRGERDRWVVATKVGNRLDGSRPSGPDLSRKHVMKAVEDSLRRLGTDYIDIYYLHRDVPETPLEESVETLSILMRQGKIRYFGLSNFRGWRIAETVRVCDAARVERPAALQPVYNALNRTAESEMLPACAHYGIAVVPYSPLARGVLTGKYDSLDAPPRGSRVARNDRRILQTEFRAESIELARAIQARATARGTTAAHLAVNWVLNHVLVSSVIAGPRTPEQWDDYVAALDYSFTAEDEALVDKLVARGHASTPGYTDPEYPVTGRMVREGAAK